MYFSIFFPRQLLEEFTWKAVDLLGKLNQLRELLTAPELPDDLNGAKLMIEDHNTARHKVVKAPIEDLESEAQQILDRISGPTHNRNSGTVHTVVSLLQYVTLLMRDQLSLALLDRLTCP